MINETKRKRFFALCRQRGLREDERRELIASHTAGRTQTMTEVQEKELDTMIQFLDPKPIHAAPRQGDDCDRLRKVVIYHMRMMGYERNGKADMARIEAYVLKYYPAHKRFNDLRYLDLVDLVTQVKAMYKKHLQQISK